MTRAVRRVRSREAGEEDGGGGRATVEAGDGGRRDGRAATVGRSVGRSMWASPARTSRGLSLIHI